MDIIFKNRQTAKVKPEQIELKKICNEDSEDNCASGSDEEAQGLLSKPMTKSYI